VNYPPAKLTKRYYSEDSLTIDQLKYIAGLEGYSEKEIDLAINDYYWIRIYSNILIEKLSFFVFIFVLIFIFVQFIINLN
jgi:hypothetical protein